MGAEDLNGGEVTRRGPIAPPLSQSQFFAWKQQKDEDAEAVRAEAARKREEDIRSGRVAMNGRELFIHEPWVFDNTQY